MLRDVLSTIRRASLIKSTYVVSHDINAINLAKALGANTIREGEPAGVNNAVEIAIERTKDSEFWIVIPSDIPFLKVSDIKNVIKLIRIGFDAVISPSIKMDGTNLLAFSINSKPELSYDRNSFWNHLADIARRGLKLAVYCRLSIMLDIDTVDDIERAISIGARAKTAIFLSRIREKDR